MGDSNTLTVSTEFGDVLVHKMVLADFAELLRALDQLPKKLGGLFDGKESDFKSMDSAAILKLIPGLLADSFDDIAGLLAVSTDKDAKFLLKLDAADSIEVLDAILELNDFVRIANAVKKIAARRAKIQPSPAKPPLQS
jgi:hypothetical protein